MLSINKAIYVDDNFCCRDYVCQVSKLQHLYVIGLILLSVLETTKQTGYIKFKSNVLKHINPTNQIDDFFNPLLRSFVKRSDTL